MINEEWSFCILLNHIMMFDLKSLTQYNSRISLWNSAVLICSVSFCMENRPEFRLSSFSAPFPLLHFDMGVQWCIQYSKGELMMDFHSSNDHNAWWQYIPFNQPCIYVSCYRHSQCYQVFCRYWACYSSPNSKLKWDTRQWQALNLKIPKQNQTFLGFFPISV